MLRVLVILGDTDRRWQKILDDGIKPQLTRLELEYAGFYGFDPTATPKHAREITTGQVVELSECFVRMKADLTAVPESLEEICPGLTNLLNSEGLHAAPLKDFRTSSEVAASNLHELICNALRFRPLCRTPTEYQITESFYEGKKIATTILTLLQELDHCDFSMAPAEYLNSIDDPIRRISGFLEKLDKFGGTYNPQGIEALDSIVHSLRGEWSTFFRNSGTAIAIFGRGSVMKDLLKVINEESSRVKSEGSTLTELREHHQIRCDEQMETLQQQFKEEVAKYSKFSAEAASALRTLKDQLGEIGASTHAVRFRNESQGQLTESYVWLSVTVALAAGMGGYAIYIQSGLEKVLTDHGAGYLWPYLAIRGIVFTLGSVILFIALRSFAACRHNCVVNKHRANALDTFGYFTEASADSDAKTAVLLEVTKTVFAPAATGYLKAANEANPSTQIIELIKNTTTQSKTEH